MKKFFKYLLLGLLVIIVSFGLCIILKKYVIKDFSLTPIKQEEKKEIKKEKKEEIYPKEEKLSMIMTGDALIHNSVFKDASLGDGNYDFTKQMEYIAPIIKNYDLAFYNQETIIGGKSLGISTYPLFNSPDEIGDCMIGMGFNMVNLASNHTLDKGEAGVQYSLNYWKGKDVLTAGSYESESDRTTPRIKEKNGIKYTLLAYTTSTNGLPYPDNKTYYAVPYSDETVKEDIERVQDKVDLIFVSMHWGTEYNQSADENQKRIASYLASLGVDIVIGTHPHVLEPIEFIDNTLVIYSLGNYISAQIGVERLTGALVSVDITKITNKDKSVEIKLDNVNADLIYTYYKKTPAYWSEFKVIPYNQLSDEILPNYRSYYEKFANIIRLYDNSIGVTPLSS